MAEGELHTIATTPYYALRHYVATYAMIVLDMEEHAETRSKVHIHKWEVHDSYS